MEMCLHWRRIIFGGVAIDSIKLGGKKREFNVASNVSRALVLCPPRCPIPFNRRVYACVARRHTIVVIRMTR